MGRVFSEYGTLITAVRLLNYLIQMLLSSDNNCPAVKQNLLRTLGKWGQLVNLLGREGEDIRMTGRFYVAVVQSVLLFGSKMKVMTPLLEKVLKGFHHRVVRRMAGMDPSSQWNGIWV